MSRMEKTENEVNMVNRHDRGKRGNGMGALRGQQRVV